MSLSNSLHQKSVQNVKLMKMNSIPTTEDLRYMLVTATKEKKPVELPFKQPSNGLTFTIKLVPPFGQNPPRWSLIRGEYDGGDVIFTRDSTEVMMIQNKIKIDSINAASSTAPEAYDETPEDHQVISARRYEDIRYELARGEAPQHRYEYACSNRVSDR